MQTYRLLALAARTWAFYGFSPLADQDMKNFIITYVAREGSSAITSSLSSQPGVVSPAFEELDRERLSSEFPVDTVGSLVFDRVFSDQEYNIEEIKRKLAQPHAQSGERERGLDSNVLFFKWRPFIVPGLIDVFKKHKITIYQLFRRDFAELVCSWLVSSHLAKVKGNKDLVNPQFTFADMPEQKRNKLLGEIDAMKVKPSRDEFIACAKQLFEQRERCVEVVSEFERHSIPCKAIFYEDYVASEEDFICRLLRAADCSVSSIVPQQYYKKVMQRPAKEKIAGIEELSRDFIFMIFEGRYEKLLRKFEPL